MKVKKKCTLIEKYAGPQHPINENSPELLFIKYACAGKAEKAVSLFRPKKLFGNVPPAVDAPFGRYEGLDGIRKCVENFLHAFHAESGTVWPVIQTRANGHAVTELAIDFVVDGEIEQIPMFVVSDLRTPNTLDEIRIYFHCSYLPDVQPYRKPIFTPAHLEMGDPGLLTGAVREYYEALHHVPKTDVDRILSVMGEGCQFGGYEPVTEEKEDVKTREDIRKAYEHMATYIPRCVGMRYETITDDGLNCIIEWVHIVSRAGEEEMGRVALSGIAAYERDDDGLLCAIRISDYAGWEKYIDWTKTPISKEEAMSINFVEEFPAGVGRKSFS